ncbi:MAG: ABC transporter permease subunit [Thermodesulfobacteriota bacterium]
MNRRWITLSFAGPGALVLALFFLTPLLVVGREGFIESGAAWGRVLKDPVFLQGLYNTLLLSITSAAFSLVVGFCVALHLSHLPENRRTAYLFLISLPLTFSGLIVAYGFILAFGRAGFITLLLAELGFDPATLAGFIYSPVGLGFAYTYFLIPRVVLLLLPVLVNFDQNQLAAAESLGAGRIKALWDVLVPQVLPTAAAAFCLVAAVALGAYGTALALVGTQVNILPLLLYSKISEAGSDFPAAAVISLILLSLCSLIMAVAEVYASAREEKDSPGLSRYMY